MLGRLHRGREIFSDRKRLIVIALYFIIIIILSATLSIVLYEFINYLSNFKSYNML